MHTQNIDLDLIHNSLSLDQKDVLDNIVQRSRRTIWLNHMAKMKGIALSDQELTDASTDLLSLLEWDFIEFQDAGFISSDNRCECGRPLRYRYVVLNNVTNTVYKLGKEHLQQFTGLDPKLVEAVSKGILYIDLERTELLKKCSDLVKYDYIIPPNTNLPLEITELLRVKLPLLDRHVRYLNKIPGFSKKEHIPKPFDFSEPDFLSLYDRLIKKSISESDSSLLVLYYQHFSKEIDEMGISKSDFKKACQLACGFYTKPSVIRNNLVDIWI